MSILDLIDGAVEAWETSDDAMRWSPDVDSHAPPVPKVVRFIQDGLGQQLERWQIELLPMVFEQERADDGNMIFRVRQPYRIVRRS